MRSDEFERPLYLSPGFFEAASAARFMARHWVNRLAQRQRETGSIAPRKQTKFRSCVSAGLEERLAALVTARPDATLAELREALPTTAALSTLWLELDRLGITFKNVHADEQRRPDVPAAPRHWAALMPLREASQYVFVDESGVTTDLLPLYARSLCGTRVADHTPLGTGKLTPWSRRCAYGVDCGGQLRWPPVVVLRGSAVIPCQ